MRYAIKPQNYHQDNKQYRWRSKDSPITPLFPQKHLNDREPIQWTGGRRKMDIPHTAIDNIPSHFLTVNTKGLRMLPQVPLILPKTETAKHGAREIWTRVLHHDSCHQSSTSLQSPFV
ncbi:hypothetical protein CEXT_561791 [Caerostris extrusa]|uniref:Uncharacterized protein n=1 Tax=Caerostris extrusa TaxID=172846 RepID=A0AAV4W3D0_CAEEX|nr:hypothetical protein CEXT_561791 [Caerostris extrusa]